MVSTEVSVSRPSSPMRIAMVSILDDDPCSNYRLEASPAQACVMHLTLAWLQGFNCGHARRNTHGCPYSFGLAVCFHARSWHGLQHLCREDRNCPEPGPRCIRCGAELRDHPAAAHACERCRHGAPGHRAADPQSGL